MCARISFVELKYSQLKINQLNDTPSTKAAGGGIYSGVFDKDVKVPVKVMRRSLLVPLLPTEISLDQHVMVLMPSLRSTPSCIIMAYTLGSLRLVNAAWREN